QVPRRVARRILNDEEVLVHDFLKLQTPEFKGIGGEGPEDFIEETEKMIKVLPCSDARIIALVGVKLKKNAWSWFQRTIEDQIYRDNPPTWETFKQMMMDEFLTASERENRALQFERLRQTPEMSVLEYAEEFIRLSKYAQGVVPTEAARVRRFKLGLIMPLYTVLAATEFPTLSRLVDKAKELETRSNEEKKERELRKDGRNKNQGKQGGD